MNSVITQTYVQMAKAHGCSVDQILENPDFRSEFLQSARTLLGEHLPERELLHTLTNLRRKSKLPRSRDLIARSGL